MKLIAILGGGDWNDASVDLMALPDGMNLETEKNEWLKWRQKWREERDEWYKNPVGKPSDYVTLSEWLERKGAREATEDEVEEVWEP